jgi:mono/diheme cytochrome c family protein
MICRGAGASLPPGALKRLGGLPEMELDVLRLHLKNIALPSAVLGVSLACAGPVQAQSATPAPENGTLDVEQLFAGTCGFCHSDGGRAAGKGPQLMNSPRDDDFLRNRIKNGKNGAMPAFGAAFSDAQIDQIVKYIRALKPREG